MSKAVMLSIRPKWCEKIASGEKTIEVRKTRPKLETPFKCYIYCTMDHPYISVSCGELDKLNYRTNTVGRCNGKVIGEFTCDRIYGLAPLNHAPDDVEQKACLTREEIVRYLKGVGYGWNISDLKIYDKPRELREFKKSNRDCFYADLGLAKRDCPDCKDPGCFLERPPQSWCYVEAMKDGN